MSNEHTESSAQTEEENFDWESRLEKLRQTRQINAPYTHAPLIKASPEPSAREREREARKLDAREREKVLHEYLLKWQEEHNAELAQEENVETDDMVLLQENWVSAQNSLQMSASEKQIESTRTVWFNPKRQTVEFPEPQNSEITFDETEQTLSDGSDVPDMPIAVPINVLNPQVIGRKEVFCLSEQELTERLIKRLRPHLTDAVNGMIRVALQKQMALFTYQLQQNLNEQAPQLVEEVLEHNLKRVMADIKSEMKFKR
ncbi:hypothetical protein [Neisseria chenwenguii]|uniref:Uncharacterized protein n=1 Tax=Neisseria chenwenguii TaxID=1853278 RepID=A0A220RZD5_9NEIS|nr:hypothetical protein [Neisseria chenwenguii]ASK26512.1 hypothetical protein BG910_00995 [Neisseria chenwenguii]ROV55954.1 hypothetical protein EGS38_07115 [Neisseria chenwenguii]